MNLEPRTLCIDVGGTGLKMQIVGSDGVAIGERVKVPTPRTASPEEFLGTLMGMIEVQGEIERISVGFPGVVVEGVTLTAPHLDERWHGFGFGAELARLTGKPVRVANDADVQGYGDIEGVGLELVRTLGTGVGSAAYIEGKLVPNLELGHAPYRGSKTYEDYLNDEVLKDIGPKKWRKRVSKVVEQIEPIWNYRVLYLGGGNSRLLKTEDLPTNVTISPNSAGLTGGIRLWAD